ncbi:16S rRNA (uracil(1498)-N(3))-methyltransferase [Saccharophagus sp. K07]|jgi:16S rRNA (uracil1498-N3)-methyltransferase|uniref:16S rRNA (uracil(1498)-N(3))-methyltransferase n=1 Tax=Saccharophagus sp. K07 TaxID=2283636 RepID=UPI001651FDC1|nr:16S rRNA (uracil(1498)-N(3))-methyltransferase [Saccharophagus sp. K07]MBC6907391.1 16S rRNA (uracil(1498)-N(3))-methyltransferase [Saccharophagus sp. K07]
MNLIILEDGDFINPSLVRLTDRRLVHLTTILKVKPADRLSVGLLNGAMGYATVTAVDQNEVLLTVDQLDLPPPPALPITLVLGLPRPKMLQRTLQTIATMGVQKLCLIQTSRVEKSFWQTPLLKPESVKEQLVLGLEQGKATQLPLVEYYPRFRPFIEDVLPTQCQNFRRLIAHPGDYPHAHSVGMEPTILAVGPEGGFVENEVRQFIDLGFEPIQLGQRILRVETAIPVLLAKLF